MGFRVTSLNSFCFWMSTTDLANYGTVLSYAVDNEDNELTFTDYGGFVLSIKGIFVYIKVDLNLLYNIFSWYLAFS